MLDLGWSELLVIGILTILIFGPKELPVVYRTVTEWLGKARAVGREFQRTMDEVARETELDKVAKDVRESTSGVNQMMDPNGAMDTYFRETQDEIRAAGRDPGVSEAPAAPAAAPADEDPVTGDADPAPAATASTAASTPDTTAADSVKGAG